MADGGSLGFDEGGTLDRGDGVLAVICQAGQFMQATASKAGTDSSKTLDKGFRRGPALEP